jgi:ATP-dependent Clp protease adaptor protein ClpS
MGRPQTHQEEDLALLEQVEGQREIVLHNDDVNTFDHVINCLCRICNHDALQAEQCAWIVHHNGKCSVKRGSYTTLAPMCTALQDHGLSATIQ